jgi:hypothetical protein
MADRQPILVTGTHRSGTTWVGRMLGASPEVGYIEEPFSLLHRRGILDVSIPFWFPYISPQNETPYIGPVSSMLDFRYHLGAELKTLRSPRDMGRMVRDWSRFARYRRRRARPLLKDPIAVFSAEWLAERFGSSVVVTIRHPAGFVSSIMRLGWTHPFEHFLRQPLLMRDLLAPFEEEVRTFAEDGRTLLDQAILLWNLIHHVIRGYRDRHPDWTFVRHEDLARDPIERFRTLYRRLGLPSGTSIEAFIGGHSELPKASSGVSPFDVRRNSQETISVWRTRLTEDQIDRVRTGVQPIAKDFYSEAEWEGTLRSRPE